MRGNEPAEQLWQQLKRSAAEEQAVLTLDQATKRVRKIISEEGADPLPDAALRFYAAEYVRMVKEQA